jgi:hypothetical protein
MLVVVAHDRGVLNRVVVDADAVFDVLVDVTDGTIIIGRCGVLTRAQDEQGNE